MNEPFELQRFVEAQERDGTYERALSELRSGRKQTHWMWFVFPQIRGLGRSGAAQHYAIGSLDEACAYVVHPVLGTRLRACAEALLAAEPTTTASEILGEIDAIKLRSSMTLFIRAAPEEPLFPQVLERYFAGVSHDATDEHLDRSSPSHRPTTSSG
jgi:uncharacterized protein (DUF1810 family)